MYNTIHTIQPIKPSSDILASIINIRHLLTDEEEVIRLARIEMERQKEKVKDSGKRIAIYKEQLADIEKDIMGVSNAPLNDDSIYQRSATSDRMDKIESMLTGVQMKAKDIALKCGISYVYANTLLSSLISSGRVERVSRGFYQRRTGKGYGKPAKAQKTFDKHNILLSITGAGPIVLDSFKGLKREHLNKA